MDESVLFLIHTGSIFVLSLFVSILWRDPRPLFFYWPILTLIPIMGQCVLIYMIIESNSEE